ncbi:CBS domain-containing protein [Chloroflexota bacterium]
MLVADIMARNVVTVPKNTTVGNAQKIMKERGFHRLPVVDNDRLVGVVTRDRLERAKPHTTAPLVWQMTYLVSHTTVSDVMRKDVVTVKSTDTVEQAIAKAVSGKVGTLIVLDEDKIVGICTPSDFLFKIVAPTLGLGESGIRITVSGSGKGKFLKEVISGINRLGIEIKALWVPVSSVTNRQDAIVHLETEDATSVIQELEKLGYTASIRPR